MQGETGPQTLSATALVHEAYLRVSKREPTEMWATKRQFFAAAAEAMRRILIDRARAKGRIKRGGELARIAFSESEITAPAKDDDLLAIDEALEKLAKVDSGGAELVSLYYFAGLDWEEIAELRGCSARTLRRQWAHLRAWLFEEIQKSGNV